MAQEVPGPPKSELEERVRMMFRQGGYAEAVPVIKVHIAENRDDAQAYELLADAMRYSGNKQGAAAALSMASDVYASKGLTIQSIAAQKRVIKLGVDPDFTSIRGLSMAASSARVPTPLFDDLSDAEFEDVAHRLEARTYEPGDVAVEEGSPGDAMFILASGSMDVVTAKGGSELKLAELRSGDFFGESALLSGRPRTATIRATSHSECLVLSRQAWSEMITKHPRVLAVMEEFNKKRAASTVEALLKKRSET